MITRYELPLTHVTRRIGRPYTLVVTKTRALFVRDVAERESWVRDLAWLNEHAKTGTPPRRKGRRRGATRSSAG